jgi:putative ABC transport system permease protein
MNLFSVAARNVLRNKFRTTLTILGGAVAVLAFVLLRTVVDAWYVGVEAAARIGSRPGTRSRSP